MLLSTKSPSANLSNKNNVLIEAPARLLPATTKCRGILRLWIMLFLAVSVFLPPRAAFSQAVSDLVRLEVGTKMSSDREDIQGSSADVKTQKVALAISLTGKPKSPESRTIQWVIFGKDLKTNMIKKIESGEQPLALDSSGRQSVETKLVETTSTPDHAIVSKARRGRASVTKVEGSGVKYLGYAVVVKDGTTFVGQVFNPRTLESEIQK